LLLKRWKWCLSPQPDSCQIYRY